MRDWQGKRYWIVGASEGLGRAVAHGLSRMGTSLVLSARSVERLQDLSDELPGRSEVVAMDVADADSVAAAAMQAGEIDGIVFLSGVYWPQAAQEWVPEQVNAMIDVNLTGCARVLGHVVPAMVARDRGHVVLTGSLAGYRGLPGAIGYGASKAGVMVLAELMYADLRGTGVEVQLANPGFIRTRLTDKNDFRHALHHGARGRRTPHDRAHGRRRVRQKLPGRVRHDVPPGQLHARLALLPRLRLGGRARAWRKRALAGRHRAGARAGVRRLRGGQGAASPRGGRAMRYGSVAPPHGPRAPVPHDGRTAMAETIHFTLDGQPAEARPGQSIWDVAHARGTTLPHLCHKPAKGYRPDGNCRACMVAVEGERVLAASCVRAPSEGMVVTTAQPREAQARRMVVEMLMADQPAEADAHDRSSHLRAVAAEQGVADSRLPAMERDRVPLLDDSHVAMRVNLDACIQCGLCVRACREVQVNDVIGMAGRGHDSWPVFDMADPMGASTCVACGECVQACPTGALMPAAMLDDAQRGDLSDVDGEVKSVCPFCGVGCQVSLQVKGGRIAHVEGIDGPANEGRLCVKGRFGFDYIHHGHRLTRPLIRRAGAPKTMVMDPADPLTHFREASWDEALDVAAAGMRGRGREIAGFGSAKCTNEEAYLFQRLIREGFGHNNVDHCTRLCHASSVAALLENVGSGAVTATFNQIEHSDVAIVIGANPVENHPVAATYFKQFAKRGGKLIVMDPRGVGLRRHASHMLQFRPGSDVALLNAIMHVIVDEGLVDRQYVEGYTENFAAQKDHLAGFSPEKMAPLTGIDAEVIRDVARTFAGARAAMIFWGMGISQHVHGTDNSRCLISLALMTGQVGRPGAGLHPLRGQNNVQGASDAGLIPMFLPDYRTVTDDGVRRAFTEVWGSDDFSAQKGLTVTEILDAVHAGDIKGMYVLGENPAMSDPDVGHAREALARLDHLVVQDIFLTETAMFADVILPAAAFAEKSGTVTNTNRQVQMGRPAVPPPGEARADWWIEQELARRLGLPWDYAGPEEVFAEMKRNMASLDNITWDRLETEGAVTYPSLTPEDPGQAIVFAEGFPRPGGRARFTPASVVPPDEVPDADYPMILTTGRQLEHWHTGSMTRRSKVLDAVEPQANCSLHPATLRALGVAPGGMLKLTTRRGSVEVMARADRAVAPDMVFLPFAYVEAAANLLTNPAIDPFGKIPEFKFCAVRAEPAMAVAAE